MGARENGTNPRAEGTNPRASEGRDLSWEALVQETHANPAMERGKLNAALKGIRAAAFSEGLHEDSLPEEIRLRAAAYRERWPQLTLTPNALAVHWFRVIAALPEVKSAQQIEFDKLRARTK